MSDDDKVVRAFPAAELPENLMAIEPRPASAPHFCAHDAVTLDEYERLVHCARCGATLDPFAFLLNNARTIQTAWASHREVKARVGELLERVTMLKKEEKRLRAMVVRLPEPLLLT